MSNVVAGAYVISAKTIVEHPGGGPSPIVTCTLDAGGGNTDTGEVAFGSSVDHATLSMLVTQVFAATGSIVLSCRSTTTADARMTRITAIKVDSITRDAVSG